MKLKIACLIIIASVVNVFGETSYSQTAKVSLDIVNKTLEEVMDEIERQSEFYFIFNQKQIDVEKVVTIQADKQVIDKVLHDLFSETNINYAVLDRKILLTTEPINEDLRKSLIIEEPRQGTVTGIVTDAETREPMPGVNVIVKGTTIGVLTDTEGKYSLNIPDPNAVLTFSFVGFITQDIPISGRGIINIQMVPDVALLEEIVVVGYGTQTKKSLTGAVSSIQSETLTSTISPTVSSAMIGKVAGVTTRLADGRPGGAAALQIRNMGTPLYVIDGVPGTESDFNNIDVNDIDNISVLKDASAAIYGLRASNGVVLVTTKLGRAAQESRINVTGYYGLQGFTRFPEQANAYQYMLGLAESAQNQGIATTITQDELDKWKAGEKLPTGDYRSFDYLDYMINPAPQYFINAGATGGSEKFKYHFSLGNLDQRATIENYYFKRSTIQANLEANLAKRLKVGTQISGRIETRHQAGVPGDDYNAVFNVITRMWPIERPYANDNPLYINNTHSININPATYKEEVTGWNDIVNRVIKTNVYTEYAFDFGLKAKATYSLQYLGWTDDCFEYTYDAYTYDQATDTYNVVVGGGNQNPIRRTGRRNILDKFTQLQLNYDKNFGNHYISAVSAFEYSFNDNTYLFVRTVPQNNYIPTMLFSEQEVLTDQWTQQSRASIIGRLNYNYRGKYLVEFLGRYDGSYIYAPHDRWGFFPGISVGWRISDEEFFSPLRNLFSELKLRGSWGQTGSETGVSAFGYLGGFNWASGSYVFDASNTVTAIRPRGLPVTNLSWVTNTSTNIGLDFAFLEGKLAGQFDLFQRKVTGIPAAKYDVLLPSEVGYTLPNENLNSTANIGLDGLISYNGHAGDLKYSVGLTGTLARAKNLESYKPRFGNSWDEYRNSTENRWTNITWGYHIIGQFQNQQEINDYPVNIDGTGNRTLLPGDLIYEDVNQDQIINTYDMLPIGFATGANPYLSVGLVSSFEYKGFTAAMNFAGAGMQTFIRNNELKIPYAGNSNGNSPEWLLVDRWHRADPFDPASEWIPGTYPATRKNLTSHSNFNKTNDFYLTNVRYFRMKTFEIGYTQPLKFIKSSSGPSVRIFANISNPFSFDNVGKKFNIDPEITNAGGLVYPQTRVFNFGFDLTL